MVVMGVNRLPEIRDYWSSDDKLHNNFIASVSLGNDLKRSPATYLHFTDNTTLPTRDEPGYHGLQKVLPIVEHLRHRFLDAYRPNVQNSIDETMIPFKGTNILHVYITCMACIRCAYMYIHTV